MPDTRDGLLSTPQREGSNMVRALSALAALLLVAASTASSSHLAEALTAVNARPAPLASTHDTTRPWLMQGIASKMSSAGVGTLPARGSVTPLQPRAASAAPLQREVMGFATAGNLADAKLGFQAWNLSLLSSVVFYGLTVNEADGSLVQSDTGATVWNSATASAFISAAHSAGVPVLPGVVNH